MLSNLCLLALSEDVIYFYVTFIANAISILDCDLYG